MVFSVFAPHLFAESTVFPVKETCVKPYSQIDLKLYSDFLLSPSRNHSGYGFFIFPVFCYALPISS